MTKVADLPVANAHDSSQRVEELSSAWLVDNIYTFVISCRCKATGELNASLQAILLGFE